MDYVAGHLIAWSEAHHWSAALSHTLQDTDMGYTQCLHKQARQG